MQKLLLQQLLLTIGVKLVETATTGLDSIEADNVTNAVSARARATNI